MDSTSLRQNTHGNTQKAPFSVIFPIGAFVVRGHSFVPKIRNLNAQKDVDKGAIAGIFNKI